MGGSLPGGKHGAREATIATAGPDGYVFRRGDEMLEEFFNGQVGGDMRSHYVCLGTLIRFDEHWLELRNADLHDFRDTETTRENYIAASRHTGIKRNRKRVIVVRDDIVALSAWEDVVDE